MSSANSVVLDASAILSVVNGEPGCDKLTPALLYNAVASTVNLAEAQTKLVSRGWDPEVAWNDVTGFISEGMVFDEEHARVAGDLVSRTHSLGLSLGDRACLSLALTLNAPVYTADRSWKNLNLGIRIHIIR